MRFGHILASIWRARSEEAADKCAAHPLDANPGIGELSAAGLRLQPVEQIIEANRELVGRIKLCYGRDTTTFSSDLLVPIRRYLEYVNQLPATMDSYFTGAGGLARIGLETAFYALQATDSQIFAGRATISSRRLLEPRWRRATFIAGLCNELHRTLSFVRVNDGKGREWQPYLMPLSRWSKEQGVDRPQVRWHAAQETRALGLFALPMIVPPETMCDLARDNATIVPQMLASIAGAAMYHEHSVMYRLVRHAAALVIHRNLRAAAGNAATRPALHTARYLIEAMRELVLSHHGWQPNIGRSRLWYGQDGLFLVWPNGIGDVVKLLEDERLPGIPGSASGVLDILEGASLVTPQSSECRIWTIYPPGASEPVEAIRFTTPSSVLAVLTPRQTPLPVQLTAMPAVAAPDGALQNSEAKSPAPSPGVRGKDTSAKSLTDSKEKNSRREFVQLQLPEIEAPTGDSAEESIADSTGVDTTSSERAAGAGRAGTAKRNRTKGSGVALSAPMRLNPEVAAALAEIVATLSGVTSAACLVDGTLLFVPLGELARRGIDARRAQRALGDAGMLAPQPDGERIQTRDVSGTKVPGLLIDARCVTGMHLDDAVPPTSTAET